MKVALKFYQRLVSVLVVTGGLVGAFLILVVTLTTFYEVIVRYVFESPTTWSLDYGIYMIMWGTFLGAAYTLKWRGHISVEVLVEKFSDRLQRSLKISVYGLALVFCIILGWTGLISCIDAYRYHEVTLSYTRTPLYVPMFSIVIGSGLMALEITSQLIELSHLPGGEK